MIRRLPKQFYFAFGFLYLFGAGILIYAQDHHTTSSGDIPRGVRRWAVVMDINVRVLDESQTELLAQSERKTTTPGSPVGIQLVGSNLVVVVQFTPLIRRGSGNVLVAQGQIWIGNPQDPQKGVSHYTSIQTIPMEFGEPIYFFPLGQAQQSGTSSGPSIEIIITVNPYNENNRNEEETVATRDNER
jgi:hypothetical protein